LRLKEVALWRIALSGNLRKIIENEEKDFREAKAMSGETGAATVQTSSEEPWKEGSNVRK
jgi:hypothetical protein